MLIFGDSVVYYVHTRGAPSGTLMVTLLKKWLKCVGKAGLHKQQRWRLGKGPDASPAVIGYINSNGGDEGRVLMPVRLSSVTATVVMREGSRC